MTRVLAIMGSGETSPTMVKTHRALMASPAALLDTPYGFQENADDISARAVEYFKESVGAAVSVASFRAGSVDPLVSEQLRAAAWVFAGPGSPSYALRVWQDSPVPGLLASKLSEGGVVVFASAAALTLGVATAPIYEIYKVGEEPRWLDGLDLLGSCTGLRAAVIPHFNNAEGGNHDTRYCYLGERRLRALEASLPADSFVLGVDEHTGLLLDLDEGSASVVGLGGVTIRRDGEARVIPAGSTVSISSLASDVLVAPMPAFREREESAPAPFMDRVGELETAFEGDPVAAALALESELVSWSRDTLQSDEMERGRAALRSMIVRLGSQVRFEPFVEALVEVRARARSAGRWDEADAVRSALLELGVEVQDSGEGSTWRLLS